MRAEVFAGARAAAPLAIEGVHVAQLELRAGRARLERVVDQPPGQVDRAVVVDADLGDDEGGLVGADEVPPDAQLSGPVAGDRGDVAARVDERHEVDAGAEQRRDLCGS